MKKYKVCFNTEVYGFNDSAEEAVDNAIDSMLRNGSDLILLTNFDLLSAEEIDDFPKEVKEFYKI